METPWKVVGFENWVSEKGENCVRLYVMRRLNPPEGSSGAGAETQRLFYKPEYVSYDPQIGDYIIPMEGRYGISKIVVIGRDDSRE